MAPETYEEFVAEIRELFEEFLAENHPSDGNEINEDIYREFLYGDPKIGLRMGAGQIALGEVIEGKRWFAPSARGLTSRILDNPTTDVAEFIERTDTTHISGLSTSITSWYRALFAAMLSRDRDCHQEVGSALHAALTSEAVARLEGRDSRPRTDLDAAIGGLLTGQDVGSLLQRVRHNIDEGEYPASSRSLLVPQTDIIDGIQQSDVTAVERGIEALDEFQRDHRSQARETHHVVERDLNIEAMAYVAYARQRGLPVTYESDYVPEGVSDDAAYPVGE